jgi:hypothetical protein
MTSNKTKEVASTEAETRISAKSREITKLPPTKKGLKKIKNRIKRELEEIKRERQAELGQEYGKVFLLYSKYNPLYPYA